MGLFSFFSKNKQESTADDSAYFSKSDEESVALRARSKRPSNAGFDAPARAKRAEEPDPALPEKKRARRRLVGAIALALAVAVGLPMILDSEPKPLVSDIAIQIPSKDKPAAPAAPAPESSSVPARDALGQNEEIVDPSAKPAPTSAPAAVAEAAPPAAAVEPPKPEPRAVTKPELPKPEVAKLAPAKPDVKAVAKLDAKPAEVKALAKADTKPVDAMPKSTPKPETPKPEAGAKSASDDDDAARALAILESKPADKPHPEASAPAPGRFVLQVAALATQDKVNELQEKLKEAGIASFTQKVPTPTGNWIRVRIGPFASRDEADKMRAKLVKLGLGGSLVPL